MKCYAAPSHALATQSHPARGAWIEIQISRPKPYKKKSHPARGAWIEIQQAQSEKQSKKSSHPARGAWIEIGARPIYFCISGVAPRKGCVD